MTTVVNVLTTIKQKTDMIKNSNEHLVDLQLIFAYKFILYYNSYVCTY